MTLSHPFCRGYLDAMFAMLWASTDDSDVPIDRNYGIGDLSDEAKSKALADCAMFYSQAGELISETHRVTVSEYGADELAGHDFWLTRNGHGAGFWDGDWSEDAGDKLDELSKQFGEQEVTVGDDGKLYLYGGKVPA